MAGYADVRRLLAQGYSMEEINTILAKPGGLTKVNEGNKRVPGAVYRQNQPNTPSLAQIQARGKKRFQQRLPQEINTPWPGQGRPPARDMRNYDPGIAELQNSPYSTPYDAAEYMGASSRPPAPAQAEPGPFVPQPPAVSSAEQKLVQATAALPGPKVNWQNGPSREFYEANAGWNADRGIGMGRRPMASQLQGATKSVMTNMHPQLDQQRNMVTQGLLSGDSSNQDAQRVNMMQQANFDMLGAQNAQSMFNPMSFMGKIFGGFF